MLYNNDKNLQYTKLAVILGGGRVYYSYGLS